MTIRLSTPAVPLHAESVPLGAAPRGAAVAVGTVAVGAGLGIVLGWDERAAELVCAVLVSFGAVVLWLAVRCGRCQVTIGSTRIDVRAGPLAATAPTVAVQGLVRRAATSWRRWYAAEEVALRISVSPGVIVLPTCKPRDVLVALGGASAEDDD